MNPSSLFFPRYSRAKLILRSYFAWETSLSSSLRTENTKSDSKHLLRLNRSRLFRSWWKTRRWMSFYSRTMNESPFSTWPLKLSAILLSSFAWETGLSSSLRTENTKSDSKHLLRLNRSRLFRSWWKTRRWMSFYSRTMNEPPFSTWPLKVSAILLSSFAWETSLSSSSKTENTKSDSKHLLRLNRSRLFRSWWKTRRWMSFYSRTMNEPPFSTWPLKLSAILLSSFAWETSLSSSSKTENTKSDSKHLLRLNRSRLFRSWWKTRRWMSFYSRTMNESPFSTWPLKLSAILLSSFAWETGLSSSLRTENTKSDSKHLLRLNRSRLFRSWWKTRRWMSFYSRTMNEPPFSTWPLKVSAILLSSFAWETSLSSSSKTENTKSDSKHLLRLNRSRLFRSWWKTRRWMSFYSRTMNEPPFSTWPLKLSAILLSSFAWETGLSSSLRTENTKSDSKHLLRLNRSRLFRSWWKTRRWMSFYSSTMDESPVAPCRRKVTNTFHSIHLFRSNRLCFASLELPPLNLILASW